MRSTGSLGRMILWLLLANLTVALLVSGAALVVLLIAPLGMAAVLACTGMVGIVSFVAGVVADALLWLRLGNALPGVMPPAAGGWREGDGRAAGRGSLPGGRRRLPEDRPR